MEDLYKGTVAAKEACRQGCLVVKPVIPVKSEEVIQVAEQIKARLLVNASRLKHQISPGPSTIQTQGIRGSQEL